MKLPSIISFLRNNMTTLDSKLWLAVTALRTKKLSFHAISVCFLDCNQISIFGYQEFPSMVCCVQRERCELEGECQRFDCLDGVCVCENK